jgi:hypothetical protein
LFKTGITNYARSELTATIAFRETVALSCFCICFTQFFEDLSRRLASNKTVAFFKTNASGRFRVCFALFVTQIVRRLSSKKTTAFYKTTHVYFIPSNPSFLPVLGTKTGTIFDFLGFSKRISFKIKNCSQLYVKYHPFLASFLPWSFQ